MEMLISIFKLLCGIGLFLFAMHLLETALKNLSGRNFKIFLQRVTKNRIGAVAGGALVTGVLQSSSMVSLMVLAFVGVGVFTMRSALAIILGTNLGTTLDSWVVATRGFKMDIEIIAYPALFISGLLLVIFGKRKSVKYFAYFIFGFGLLFIGLSFMKIAMEAHVKNFNFSQYAEMSLAVFLLIGFIITLLVQSSSVTMALTLSALFAGAIDFPAAAAIVLGSETGTTIKIMLSAIGGTVSKKRIVLGNLIFNVVMTILGFIFLSPILQLITDVFKIKDPLIGLVTFATLINFASVIIFLPILDPFAKFLERFYKRTNAFATAYIGNANIEEPNSAIELFKKETEYFIYNSVLHNLSRFEIETNSFKVNPDFNRINEERKFLSKTKEEKYEILKQVQGELQSFYLDLRGKLDGEQNAQIGQLISAVRSSMHSVKSVKDLENDIDNLSRSAKDIKFKFFMNSKKELETIYAKLCSYMSAERKVSFEELERINNEIHDNYTKALNDFYKEAHKGPLEDMDMTIVINFNRELFTSNKAMLMAMKDNLLIEKEASDFNQLLVYKT